MDFIIYFHLQNCSKSLLIKSLQQCSGIPNVKRRKRTDDLLDKILADVEAYPNYLVVNQSSSQWHSVECNSFKKLHDWGKYLSATLDTVFLQTVYSSINDYTYLLAYERGQKIREIEGVGASRIPRINEGKLFPFEQGTKDGDRANDLRMFDLDNLAGYCHALGIDLTCLQVLENSVVLEEVKSDPVMFNVQRVMKQHFWEIEKGTRLTGIRKPKGSENKEQSGQ